jgi:hypothetical protein
VGFEPTIPGFERAKTVHALDRAVTVIGNHRITTPYFRQAYRPTCDNISHSWPFKRPLRTMISCYQQLGALPPTFSKYQVILCGYHSYIEPLNQRIPFGTFIVAKYIVSVRVWYNNYDISVRSKENSMGLRPQDWQC